MLVIICQETDNSSWLVLSGTVVFSDRKTSHALRLEREIIVLLFFVSKIPNCRLIIIITYMFWTVIP